MRLAALQMQAVSGDVEANLARIDSAAAEAAAKGAELLVAPELAVSGYGAGETIAASSELTDGRIVRGLKASASEHRIAIIAGFAEHAEGAVWNSAILVGVGNSPVVYRKSHLYGDYERGLFRPGPPAAVTFELAGLKVGMLICYDVEFPENLRRLARAGCDLVVVPTALPAGDHAEFIARQMIAVRAFENQLFVAYANHCGADALFSYAGLSAIAAPDGSLLAAARETGETLLVADIRPADFAASAAENTYLRDLRT